MGVLQDSVFTLFKLSRKALPNIRSFGKTDVSSTTRLNVVSESDCNRRRNCSVQVGDVIQGRFIVQYNIGSGSFGTVYRAWDKAKRTFVALKILNGDAKDPANANEIRVLEKLNAFDEEDQRNIVRLLEHFVHQGHLVLVLELLGPSLSDYMKNNRRVGLPLPAIQIIASQLLEALCYLHSPPIGLIHGDLKPENVLLVDKSTFHVKLADFGTASAPTASSKKETYLQSRYYRAPEVLLGLPFDGAIDMWSLGCVLAELHTGVPLLKGITEQDQMFKVAELLGLPPAYMMETGPKSSRYFLCGRGSWKAVGKDVVPRSRHLWNVVHMTRSSPSRRPLKSSGQSQASHAKFLRGACCDLIGGCCDLRGGCCDLMGGQSQASLAKFFDLLHACLRIDPHVRLTPLEALSHPFLTDSLA